MTRLGFIKLAIPNGLVLTRCGYPPRELLLLILLGRGSFGSRVAFPTTTLARTLNRPARV
jgi:hypothetical protein